MNVQEQVTWSPTDWRALTIRCLAALVSQGVTDELLVRAATAYEAIAPEVTEQPMEADRYRQAMLFIADSCSHVTDTPDQPIEWDTHLHEPAPNGGHRFCGPCAAFRALGGGKP